MNKTTQMTIKDIQNDIIEEFAIYDDWMDKYEAAEARIDRAEEKIDEQEAEVREKAREKGRLEALKAAKKVDPVFYPNKFNPDDAKVMPRWCLEPR